MHCDDGHVLVEKIELKEKGLSLCSIQHCGEMIPEGSIKLQCPECVSFNVCLDCVACYKIVSQSPPKKKRKYNNRRNK